jgi:O-antigen/teichoic acid export membrane protein
MPAAALFGIGLLATFLSQAFLSRVMTLAEFGTFTVLYSAGAILSGLGTLGFDLSIMRFIPSALAHGDRQAAKAFGAYSLRLVLWSSAIVGVMTSFYTSFHDHRSAVLATILGLCAASWTLVRYISGALRARGHNNLCLFVDRVLRDGGLALIGGYILLSSSLIDLTFVAIVLVILCVAGCIIGSLRLEYFNNFLLPKNTPIPKTWVTASIGLLAVNVTELFGARIDIFLASLLINAESAGAIGVLLTLTSLVTIPSAFINVITMPTIAHYKELGDYKKLRKLLVTSTILAFVGSAVIASLFLVARDLIFGIFSQEAIALVPTETFFLILGARVLGMISHAMAPLLMMTGGERKLISAHAISIVTKLAFCSFFLSNFDISAVGILISFGIFSLSFLQMYFGITAFLKVCGTNNLP